MLVEVTDSESQRSTADRSRRVSLQRPGVDAPETIFIDTPRSHDSTQAARIHNYGGDILFGSAVSLYTELPADSFPGSTVDVAVQFAMISPGDEEEIVLRRDTVAGVRPVRRPRPVRVVDTLGLAYIEGKAAQPVVTTLTVPLKTERLPLRRYRMTAAVTAGDRPLTCVREFRMIWPDMPRSLRNVDEAIAALRYIATETTMDSLMDGPLEVRWARLEGFWKPRDRSPETAPNEVMTEYYRRVDYAREAFGTLRQADGFLTDRGRIYVLHGAPTGTERTLDPAEGFTEVWTYGRTSKTFVFVDRAKTGDYILVQRPPQ
jgi:GWxTD domain-containing protein